MELESEPGFLEVPESEFEFEYPRTLVSELESVPKFSDSPALCDTEQMLVPRIRIYSRQFSYGVTNASLLFKHSLRRFRLIQKKIQTFAMDSSSHLGL